VLCSDQVDWAAIATTATCPPRPGTRRSATTASPLFDSPWGLAFMGQSLLVTNADIQPVESPDHWKVLQVFVGEDGLPLNRPGTSGDDGNPTEGAVWAPKATKG
jgi:hypothetical protein